jgi:transposase InsO family protein
MGDYLSLPNGKGGFKTVGLYIDAYSQFLFYTKLKTAGTGKSMASSLHRICSNYATPATFMSDGGSHFNNKEVDSFCEANNIQKIVTPAYSPWVNGLIENANKLLLGRLKRLCALDIDAEFNDDNVDPKLIPTNRPDHIDKAIQQLND